jgi:predicted dehydrogenase
MNKQVRIGIWGAGAWARICSKSIQKVPELRIASVFDSDPATQNDLAGQLGAQAPPSLDSFLGTSGMDAVCIFTPNYLHHDHVLQALAHGLHVFVEKPMANSTSESRSMVEASQQANKILFVGHNTRRESRFRLMKSLMNRGEIGKPVMACCTFTSEAGLGRQLGGWRYDKDLCPAVALSQIGIHAIDLLIYILSEIEEVQAWITRVGLEGDVEDVCLARLLHVGGYSSTFNNAYSVPRARSLEIHGTGGALLSYSVGEIFYQPLGADPRRRVESPLIDTVEEEYAEFARCCLTGDQPETGGPEGFAAVAAMEAMILSSNQGGVVTPVAKL